MHELGITEEIIRIAARAAESAGASHIVSIHLSIGDLASIMDDSIRFYFNALAEDTPASGAELVISRHPAELACCHCDNRFRLEGRTWLCPKCGGPAVLSEKAAELLIESVEVER